MHTNGASAFYNSEEESELLYLLISLAIKTTKVNLMLLKEIEQSTNYLRKTDPPEYQKLRKDLVCTLYKPKVLRHLKIH